MPQPDFINSKKAALNALGSLAEGTGKDYFPYAEKTLNAMLHEECGSFWSYHGVVRAASMEILPSLLRVVCLQNGPTEEPKAGELINLNPITAEVCNAIVATVLNCIADDTDKRAVSSALEAIGEVIPMIGVALLAFEVPGAETPIQFGQMLFSQLQSILKEKTPCQMTSEIVDEEDDDGDHDALVVGSACNTLGVLAKVLGTQFVSYFSEFERPLLRYMKPSRTHADRTMVLGCLSDIAEGMGNAVAPLAERMLPLAEKCLQDNMSPVRRNAAVLIGTLCGYAPDVLAPKFTAILGMLYPLCVRRAEESEMNAGGADVDNALACSVPYDSSQARCSTITKCFTCSIKCTPYS